MLKTALIYLKRGWSIIPLHPREKSPPLVGWDEFKQRRPTEALVKKWWLKWPEANIGVITGAISGIVVLDVDGPEGDQSLKGREMPITPQSTTGKGTHHWYRYPGHHVKGSVRFLPGLDIRADGNYVLAPPSVHPNGSEYCWAISPDRTEIDEVPGWLLAFIKGITAAAPTSVDLHVEDQSGEDWYEKALLGVEAGARNDTLVRLCGRFLGLGHTPREVWRLLRNWNAINKPPIEEAEFKRSVSSIVSREAQKATEGSDTLLVAPDANRDAILATINQMFEGIELRQIIKYLTEPAVYALRTSAGEVRLGGIENLIRQDRLRMRIAENDEQILKRFKQKTWDQISELLLRVCVDVEVAEEVTDKGRLRYWIESYLADDPPVDEENKTVMDVPMCREGHIYMSSRELRNYITKKMDESITPKQLAIALKEAGCKRVTVKIGDNSTKRWWLSESILKSLKLKT